MEYTKKIALFDPCTKKEYRDGDLDAMMVNYLDYMPSKEFSIDFIFIFNTLSEEDDNYEALKIYEAHENVNEVIIESLELTEEEDIYIKETSERPVPLPKLGGSTGPNLSFYRSFELLLCNNKYDYDYFFMLESDSYTCKDYWLDHVISFAENNDFSIAGSRYKGDNKWHYVLDYKDHLNGIAIYKNNQILKSILSEGQAYHESLITKEDWFMNFDIALDKFIKTDRGQQLTGKKNKFIDTDFIINVSDPLDNYLTKEEIRLKFKNAVIIHQKKLKDKPKFRGEFYPEIEIKDYNRKKIPTFLHIPRCAGTTAIAWNTELLHAYCKKNNLKTIDEQNSSLNLRRLVVNVKGIWQILVFCYDHANVHQSSPDFKTTRLKPHPTLKGKYISEHDPYVDYIDIENLYKHIESGNIEIFSIIIEPQGANLGQRFSLRICQELCNMVDADPCFYTALREPFEITKSIHAHSKTNKSFEDFVESDQLQDSLIIRALSDIQPSDEIAFYDYHEARRLLNKFKVKDLKEIEELIDEVFWECYQIKSSMLQVKILPKNTSKHKTTLEREDLKLFNKTKKITLEQYFNGRVFFDDKIYKEYCL